MANIIIDTKEKLKEISGKDSAETVGNALAIIVINARMNGKMTLYKLAKKFSNDKTVELTPSDVALLKSAIEDTTAYNTALVPGQLLEMITEPKRLPPEASQPGSAGKKKK